MRCILRMGGLNFIWKLLRESLATFSIMWAIQAGNRFFVYTSLQFVKIYVGLEEWEDDVRYILHMGGINKHLKSSSWLLGSILQKVSSPNLSQIWRPDRSFATLPSQMEELKVINQRTKNVVLYHYPCPDGIFAALAAHLYHTAVVRPVTFLPNTVYDPIR